MSKKIVLKKVCKDRQKRSVKIGILVKQFPKIKLNDIFQSQKKFNDESIYN